MVDTPETIPSCENCMSLGREAARKQQRRFLPVVTVCSWDVMQPGAGIMESDDRQVTTAPTVIPPSALDKPSVTILAQRRCEV